MRVMRYIANVALWTAALSVGYFAPDANLAQAQGDAKRRSRYPQHILIIRHAEKTGQDGDLHLSKKGFERAGMLFQLFEASKERPDPFPAPDFIFAASNSTSSQRPVETITPSAKKLRLTIDQTFESKKSSGVNKGDPKEKAVKVGMFDLRAEILGNPKYFGKTILVSWRHSTIPELAKTLGAKNAPSKWESTVFDRVWQLSFDDKGNTAFFDRPQRLLPGDARE